MSDGLIGDEFTNRPDDDELAFLHYEKLFRAPLEKELAALQDPEGDGYWNSYNHFMQTYINSVIATVKALDLPLLEYWTNNPASANDEKNFKQIKFDIDGTITQIKVSHAQRVRKASVHLEGGAREKIRELINKIKLTIDAIDIPLPRKEALMSKLNAFAAEADRERTRFEAFAALMIEAAGMVGKVEKKLRPIRGWIDSIAKLLHEARAVEDRRPRLPAPDKRIEAPQKRLAPPSGELWAPQEPPKTTGGDLDDEIPF
jgi:hypothetical protein